MDKMFCGEFGRVTLKFHTKYLTHTLKDAILIQRWNFKSSSIQEFIYVILLAWIKFDPIMDK